MAKDTKSPIERLKQTDNRFVCGCAEFWRSGKVLIIVAVLIALTVTISGFTYVRIKDAKLAQGQLDYQDCLDKVSEESPEFKTEWTSNGRPYYEQAKGYWEIGFMKWLVEEYPDFCADRNLESISFFTEERLAEIMPNNFGAKIIE